MPFCGEWGRRVFTCREEIWPQAAETMKRASLRKILSWLAVAVAVAFVVYRVGFTPLHVTAHPVATGEIVGEVMGTGTLEARVKTIVGARMQERLAEVLVDQGDRVKSGQLLARLDEGELRRQVDVAAATLAAAKATAERIRVDEVRARAVEQQARQKHKRTSDLVGAKVSSPSDFDKSIEELHIAESGLQLALAATTEAEQQTITAEKNLAFQQERLGFAQILSPYDGLVVRRDRDPGGVVVPGASILQLISTDEIWVSAWVDETAASGLAAGQPVRVVFRSAPEKIFAGEVARLGRETDRETREFLVDVRVRELPANWTLGQRAEVFIETGRKPHSLVLPQQFLQWRGGRPGVFVADHGRAAWRDLALGLRGHDTVEVTEGLSAGDRVIVSANPMQAALHPGQRIATE
jgi:HlyD family secretion protein